MKLEKKILLASERITDVLVANVRVLDQFTLELTAVWAENVARVITKELKRRRRAEMRNLKRVVEHGPIEP